MLKGGLRDVMGAAVDVMWKWVRNNHRDGWYDHVERMEESKQFVEKV